jgi:hypothetical protein
MVMTTTTLWVEPPPVVAVTKEEDDVSQALERNVFQNTITTENKECHRSVATLKHHRGRCLVVSFQIEPILVVGTPSFLFPLHRTRRNRDDDCPGDTP